MASYDFITDSGTIVADTSQTKSQVQQEYLDVFGEDLDLSDQTPQGILINLETLSRNGVAINNANLANQINPNIAGGIYLDAIWELTVGLTGGRDAATHSVFPQQVDITGVPGTNIPEGSLAQTPAGDQFETLSNVTIPIGGSAVVSFQSVETGPIPCAVGELNQIVSGAPLGWETVNNPAAAILGQDRESDGASRIRRRQTLALQGQSTPEAVTSRLYNLPGVRSLSFRENVASIPQNIDGVLMVPHSIYVCVDGGLDSLIAQALLASKSAGSAWNGAVTVPTTDPTSGQIYDVTFDRPEEVQVWIRVTIAETTVSNAENIVIDSVLSYANGDLDGEEGFVVGGNVSPYEIAYAVNVGDNQLFVRNVELSLDGGSYFTNELAIEVFQVARTSSSQILVVVQ